MDRASHRLAAPIDRPAGEPGFGQFPNVSGNVDETVLVSAECPDRLWLAIDVAVTIAGIDPQRPLARIVRVGYGVVLEPACGGVGPLFVGRQPIMLAGLARQPRRLGLGIPPAHPYAP